MALTQVIGDGLATSGLPAGSVVQVVNVIDSAVASTSTTLTNDDSIPQNTEGGEFMTLAITPTSATHKLLIEVVVHGSPNGAAAVTSALFQDTTANALSATGVYMGTGTGQSPISFQHYMTAGTTDSTTFKVRVGAHSGNFTFNGTNNSTRIYGGVAASSITIMEIAV